MLENGKLVKDDIIGTSNYLNADGEINDGIVIVLKEIEIATPRNKISNETFIRLWYRQKNEWI